MQTKGRFVLSDDKINERDFLRETYIEINLDKVEYNLNAIRTMCGSQVKIGAVIKADAYGHGAKYLADTLVQNGADLLCVATLSEAIELKKTKPKLSSFNYGINQFILYRLPDSI